MLEPTPAERMLQIATGTDVSNPNANAANANCLDAESFIPSLARGKLIICEHVSHSMYGQTFMISTILETIRRIGAAGVIFTSDQNLPEYDTGVESTMTLPLPGIVLHSDGSQVSYKGTREVHFQKIIQIMLAVSIASFPYSIIRYFLPSLHRCFKTTTT